MLSKARRRVIHLIEPGELDRVGHHPGPVGRVLDLDEHVPGVDVRATGEVGRVPTSGWVSPCVKMVSESPRSPEVHHGVRDRSRRAARSRSHQ